MSATTGTLLVVGDDGVARMLLESHLESLGYEVLAASGRLEALGALGRESPEAVIELGFGGESRSLLEALAAARLEVPVIVLAAAGAVEAARAAGAAAALTLPAPRPLVAETVEAILTRARAARLNAEPTAAAHAVAPTLPSLVDETPAASPPSGGPPARVGRYVVRELLGRGGNGNVYRCWDPNLDRLVAVKTIRHELTGDPDLAMRVVERFKREAAASARLVHPGIVATYDFGLDDQRGELYLAMELVDGPSLRTLLAEEGRLEPSRALLLAWQMADALAHAHELEVVHRDVKPENVLLAGGRRAKMADFGLARIGIVTLSEGSAELAGTPGYMAPEQIRGAEVDARTDQFSLGAVLAEMLTGEGCFDGESVAARLHSVLDASPPDLAACGVEAPEGLQALLARTLEKWPNDRFPTDSELLAELAAVGGRLGLHLQRAS